MIKKVLLAVCFSAAILGGCSSTTPKVAKGYNNPALDGAPAWVLDPTTKEGLAAVGSAQHSPGGIQFQRTEAMASGRDELTRMLSIKVKNVVDNFQRQTGVADNVTFDKVTAATSRQLAQQTLNGSRQKDLWLAPDGTMYILVALDPKSVADIAKESIKTSLKHEQALYQQVEAKKALEQLDAEIDKEFSR